MGESNDFESRWHEWGKASFLIRPVPLLLLLELNTKVQNGELDAEGALKEVFNFCLLDWRGMEINKECREHPEYHRAARDAFWENAELRFFVLDKVIGELSYRTFALEELAKKFERLLLISGKLKS